MPATPRPDRPVLLTRSRADNARLAALLRQRGIPTLSWTTSRARLAPVDADDLARAVASADVVTLTSRRGALALRALLGRRAAELLSRCRLAVVGASTAAVVARLGLRAEWTGDAGAEALGERLARELGPGTRVLLARAEEAPDAPVESLREAGLVVDDRRVYRQEAPPRPDCEPLRLGAVACASPSAAERLLAWHPWLAGEPFVAIGETTAAALRRLGVARIRVAPRPDPASLADALSQAREENP